jgi:hypothetical protein
LFAYRRDCSETGWLIDFLASSVVLGLAPADGMTMSEDVVVVADIRVESKTFPQGYCRHRKLDTKLAKLDQT